MDYKDLKDSYSKLSNAVEELATEGQILVVRNKDGNPRVLFHNDAQYNTTIDPGNVLMYVYIKGHFFTNCYRFADQNSKKCGLKFVFLMKQTCPERLKQQA